MNSTDLEHLGWTPALEFYLGEAGGAALIPGRVSRVDRGGCRLLTAHGERTALWTAPVKVVGEDAVPTPAVGDWCAARPADEQQLQVVALFPRKTRFARTRSRDSGRGAEQVIAANIDLAFLVLGLDRDFSVRRLERYLVLTRNSGAQPLILLNKADLHQTLDRFEAEAAAEAPGVAVHAVSALEDSGLDTVQQALPAGVTGVFLGSSGAGKSTLINRLLGQQLLATRPVRQRDQRGQHTTTHRELILLPGGGVVIDTPGLREVGVMGDQQALQDAFADLLELAQGCRFADCLHLQEPGCAVVRGVEQGLILAARVESFQRLQREMHSARRRQSVHEQRTHERQTYGKYRTWMRNNDKRK